MCVCECVCIYRTVCGGYGRSFECPRVEAKRFFFWGFLLHLALYDSSPIFLTMAWSGTQSQSLFEAWGLSVWQCVAVRVAVRVAVCVAVWFAPQEVCIGG